MVYALMSKYMDDRKPEKVLDSWKRFVLLRFALVCFRKFLGNSLFGKVHQSLAVLVSVWARLGVFV